MRTRRELHEASYYVHFVQPIVKYFKKSYVMNDEIYFYNIYIILKIYNYNMWQLNPLITL